MVIITNNPIAQVKTCKYQAIQMITSNKVRNSHLKNKVGNIVLLKKITKFIVILLMLMETLFL